MTKTEPTWDLLSKLPDGHRLFGIVRVYIGSVPSANVDDPRGLFAVADDSGHDPQDTDDGILWLDFTRNLKAGEPATHSRSSVAPEIPLLDKTGKPCSTITDACTLLTLSNMFNWPITCLDTIVQVFQP